MSTQEKLDAKRARNREYMRKRRADPEVHAMDLESSRRSAEKKRRANGVQPRKMRKGHTYADRKRLDPEGTRLEVKTYYENRKAKDPDFVKKTSRIQACKKAGITVEQYEEMLEAQDGVCAICEQEDSANGGRSLAIDHCHDTGKVRGLLCMRCNIALGKLRDSPKLMMRAAHYIRHHRNQHGQK